MHPFAFVIVACAPDRSLGSGDTDFEPYDPMQPVLTGPLAHPVPEPEVTWSAIEVPEFEVPGVVINEVMARNDSTVMDPASQSTPDWVELYNSSDVAVALSDLSLSDGAGQAWQGGSGSLAPGGHLRLWCSNDLSGDDVAPFGLSEEGESLELSVMGVVTDRVATGIMPADVALVRYPDGGAWSPGVSATPGWANVRPSGSTDPSSTIYQDDAITEFRFWLSPESLSSINTGEREVEASMQYEGMFFSSVAMRLKGSGSYENMSGKPALRVDVNAFESDARLRGLKGLTFNNGSHDATWAHEYLTYFAYRSLGVSAPRTGWSRLYINDEYYGLYMNIEQHDDVFLSRWYVHSEEGALYEGSWSDFQAGSELSMDYEEGPDEQDLTILTEVSAVMSQRSSDESIGQLRTYVDLDQVALYMALETLTMHWDGYKSPNNWRFYHNPVTSLWEWMPTGTDWTLESETTIYAGNGEMFTYCLDNPDCRDRYTEIARATCDAWAALPLEDMLDHSIELLDADIAADPRDHHTSQSTNQLRGNVRHAVTDWVDEVRGDLDPI